jgi:hypothetical protein
MIDAERYKGCTYVISVHELAEALKNAYKEGGRDAERKISNFYNLTLKTNEEYYSTEKKE